jgi:hypothetical protein
VRQVESLDPVAFEKICAICFSRLGVGQHVMLVAKRLTYLWQHVLLGAAQP